MKYFFRRLFRKKERYFGLSLTDLGFIPRQLQLYRLAFVHKSASYQTKNGILLNNERLEFLGDAVISAAMADILYKYFPQKDEGFLTQIRSRVVSRESLNEVAVKMGLDKQVVAKCDISTNKHVFGDVFEAFMGAIYLDQGYRKSKNFLEKKIIPRYIDLDELIFVDKNYKSRLIEWAQQHHIDLRLDTKEIGNKGRRGKTKFITTIFIRDKKVAEGLGENKKKAEQAASENAMAQLPAEGRQ